MSNSPTKFTVVHNDTQHKIEFELDAVMDYLDFDNDGVADILDYIDEVYLQVDDEVIKNFDRSVL